MARRKLDGSYQTIGAISGHFWPREKPRTGMSQPEKDRVASALASALARNMSAQETVDYVLARMAFDHPACPGGRVLDHLRTLDARIPTDMAGSAV
jgi:hypothetical protein